ncbi:uncharacterized protein [Rutidosis leptorrhynchoides]|uniref:uncharacterized protein n=1 Tax=Rutidosis leptorrhynchoides TaxID=125765 RepID=UPI003A990D87
MINGRELMNSIVKNSLNGIVKTTQMFLSSSAKKTKEELDCVIRPMVREDEIVFEDLHRRARSRFLWLKDPQDWYVAHGQKMSTWYGSYVDNGPPIVYKPAPMLYGALQLQMPMDTDCFFPENTPPEWIGKKGTDAYISGVLVAPEHRNQLVGTKLVRYALAEAKKSGMERCFLIRHKDNWAAANLCHKVGFEVVVPPESDDEYLLGIHLK